MESSRTQVRIYCKGIMWLSKQLEI
jgi:hypothetical protein